MSIDTKGFERFTPEDTTSLLDTTAGLYAARGVLEDADRRSTEHFETQPEAWQDSDAGQNHEWWGGLVSDALDQVNAALESIEAL
jgi:hypothetical protein